MIERRLKCNTKTMLVLVSWSVLLTTSVHPSPAAAAAAAAGNVSMNSNLSQSAAVIRKGTADPSSSTLSPILQIPSPFVGCHQRSLCASPPHPPHPNAFVSQQQQQQQSPGVTRNCFCDDQCSIYDDCCDDIRNSSAGGGSGGGGGGGGGGRSLRPFVQCQRMASGGGGGDRTTTNTTEVYVITRCRDVTYHDHYVRERCEKPYKSPATDDDDDRFYRLPVRGGPPFYLLYRNTFCAVCSADQDFTFWSAVLRCGGGDGGGGGILRSPPSSRAVAAGVNGSSPLRAYVDGASDCSTAFVPSRESLGRPAPRPCRVSIGRCDPSWTQDKAIARRCRERTDYVFAGTRTFRNRECAICNYVNETYIRCDDNRQTTTMTSSPEAEANSKIVVEESVLYSVALDFNRRRASVSFSSHETTFVFPDCPEDKVYDPFVDRCRLISSCRHGYSRRKDDCVADDSSINAATSNAEDKEPRSHWPNNNRPIDEVYDDDDDYLVHLPPEVTSEPAETVTSSNGQCPLLTVNATDLVRLDNGSTYLVSLRTILSPHQQLIRTGDQVHVCLPDLIHETGNHQHVDRMFLSPRYNFTMFQFDAWQRPMSVVGAVLCLLAIFIQLLVYAMFTSLWATTDGKSVVCLSLSLFLAQLLYLFAVLVWEELPGPMVCFVVGQAMQYFFVASFCWLNVLSIDVFRWLKSSDPSSSTYSYISEGECCSRFVWYSIYAWTVPLIVVTGSVATVVLRIDGWHPYDDPHRSSPGPSGGCWVLGLSQLMLFALPICLMLTVNAILFVVAVCKFCFEAFPARFEHQRNKYKQRCVVTLQLSALMGMAWMFAVVAAVTRRPFLWSLFIVFDALQGLFLCSAFVCTRKVWRLFCAKSRIRRLSDGTSSGRSSGAGSKLFRTKGGGGAGGGDSSRSNRTTTTSPTTKSKNKVIMLETSI